MGDEHPTPEHHGHGYSYGDDAKHTNDPRMGDHEPEPVVEPEAEQPPAGDSEGDADQK